jgi:hypothetical protein
MGNAAFINCDTTSVCLQYNADYNAIPGGYSKLSNIEITAHTTAPSVDLNAANFVQFDNVKLSGQSTVMTMESVMWAQFNNSIFAVSSPWGTGGTNSATGLGNANQYAIHYSVPAGPYPEGSNIHFNQSRILGTGILIDATTDIVGGGIGPWYIDGLRYQSGLTSLITLSTLNHGVLRSLEISDLDNEDNQCWNGSSWLVNSCGTYQWPLIYITPGYTNTIGRLYGDFLGQWAGPLVNPGAPQIDSGSISGEPTVAMYSLGGQSNIKLDTTGSTNTPIRPTTIPYATQSLNAWGGTFTTVPGPDGVATSGVAYTSSAPWNSTLWSIPESSASAGDWFIVGGWVQGTGTQQYGTCGYQIYDLSSTGGAFNGSGNPQVSILPASQENTDKAWYFVSTAAKLTTKGTGGTITFIANGPGGSFCASDATNYSSPFVVWVHNPTVTDAEVIRWKNDMLVGIIPGGVSAGTVIGGTGSAFGALTGGTNTAAAMLVGTGASLAPTGTGVISATTTAGMTASGNIAFGSGGGLSVSWNNDTALMRIAANSLALGNGSAFDTSGSLRLGGIYLTNSTFKVFTSAGSLTADRAFTLPDANSNPVQPLGSATTGQWVQFIDSLGVQHLAAPPGSFITSLTTTGTSGAASVSSGVLNIPQYSGGGSMTWPAGGAGVPNYNGSSAWGTSYNASNPFPANFIPTLNQNTTGTAGGLSANIAESQVTNLVTDLAAKAPLVSPSFTTPVLGTPASGVITNLTGTCTSCSVGGNAATATSATSATSATTAANLSGTPALPNGTTATTQTTGDATTKLATDAFVGASITANAYTLPTATNSVLGGVNPDGTTITNSSGAISVTYGTVANTAARGNDSRITGAVQTGGALGTPSSGTLTNATGLPISGIAAQAADTVAMNATGGSASPTAVAMPTCTAGANLYNTSTHSWSCVSTGGGGTPSYPVTVAGTVTSGGIPYFSATTTETSSGILNSNILVRGGGAGGAPTNSSITDDGTTVSTAELVTFSGGSTTSTSGVKFTGTPLTGGSATTTFPLVSIGGGAAGNYNTSGTILDINTPSGFTGNSLCIHQNGGNCGLSASATGATVTVSISLLVNYGVSSKAYSTNTNCAVNSASPAACGTAAAGAFVVPTLTTTYTVNTTAVTANSRIFLQPISFASNLPLSPTCVAPAITGSWTISAIVAGTSFTFTLTSTTGQTCWQYWIIN